MKQSVVLRRPYPIVKVNEGRPHTTLSRVVMTVRGKGPRTTSFTRPKMNASDTSPSLGNEGSDRTYNYATVGQMLLKQELELQAFRFRESFIEVSRKVERSDDLEESDVRELRDQIEQAQLLVDVIEEGIE